MTFDHEFTTQVLAKHIDGYGHVNNAVYLQFFEEARWDWIQQGGGDRDLVQSSGVGPIVVGIELRFSRELIEGDKITVKSTQEGEIGRVYTLKQLIYKESGEMACKASYRLAFMDIKARKIVEAPQKWREVLMAPILARGKV